MVRCVRALCLSEGKDATFSGAYEQRKREAKRNSPGGRWIALGEKDPGVASIRTQWGARFCQRRRAAELPRGMQRPSEWRWTTLRENGVTVEVR